MKSAPKRVILMAFLDSIACSSIGTFSTAEPH